MAFSRPEGGATLVRDWLGINKLFLAVHESGRVLIANYLIDLVRRGVPFEAIYSVPAGHSLEIDFQDRIVLLTRYGALDPEAATQDAPLESIARDIREQLEVWFARLAERFGRRRICVCLSGGIDSGVIAAIAKEYFPHVIAYTYGFAERGHVESEDVSYAERLADVLRIPFRLVRASSEDVLAALDDALCYGQDWRDFNVHCAIVNVILARAIRSDAEHDGAEIPPLLLTGDLANEFLADYTPVWYEGQQYYRLPRLSPGALQRVLIRGLDAGDREVGIFNHHGLDVIQPYGLVVDGYLRLHGPSIGGERFKQRLAKAIAGDLLPDFVFDRVKVRAQIGSSIQPTGILPVLIGNGYDSRRLRRDFCRLFMIGDETFLDTFIRAGRYRFLSRFPEEGLWINGYLGG
ncbi:MAG TPA: asparagine synthase-related protein [Candidatus Acidoferrales bacterium]|nr:asparagine synthase-related protein [Candidatus Acidoferrales bacterium]